MELVLSFLPLYSVTDIVAATCICWIKWMRKWMDSWVGGVREGWIDDWVGHERVCISSSSCGHQWEIFLRPADSKVEPKVSEVKWGPLKSISFSTKERKPVKLPHVNASQNSNFVFFLEPQHQGYWKSDCTTYNAWAARSLLERWHWKNSTDLA